MNWKNIRVYNNSQNNAFEELVCQLARQEKTSGYKRFVRNDLYGYRGRQNIRRR